METDLPESQPPTVRIVVCYARNDACWMDCHSEWNLIPWLQDKLRSLGGCRVDFWWDSRLDETPGIEWEHAIRQRLNEADITIFLLSIESITSEFVRQVELPIMRERAQKGEMLWLPILVGPMDWGFNEESRQIKNCQIWPSEGPTPLKEFARRAPDGWDGVRVRLLHRVRELVETASARRTAAVGEAARKLPSRTETTTPPPVTVPPPDTAASSATGTTPPSPVPSATTKEDPAIRPADPSENEIKSPNSGWTLLRLRRWWPVAVTVVIAALLAVLLRGRPPERSSKSDQPTASSKATTNSTAITDSAVAVAKPGPVLTPPKPPDGGAAPSGAAVPPTASQTNSRQLILTALGSVTADGSRDREVWSRHLFALAGNEVAELSTFLRETNQPPAERTKAIALLRQGLTRTNAIPHATNAIYALAACFAEPLIPVPKIKEAMEQVPVPNQVKAAALQATAEGLPPSLQSHLLESWWRYCPAPDRPALNARIAGLLPFLEDHQVSAAVGVLANASATDQAPALVQSLPWLGIEGASAVAELFSRWGIRTHGAALREAIANHRHRGGSFNLTYALARLCLSLYRLEGATSLPELADIILGAPNEAQPLLLTSCFSEIPDRAVADTVQVVHATDPDPVTREAAAKWLIARGVSTNRPPGLVAPRPTAAATAKPLPKPTPELFTAVEQAFRDWRWLPAPAVSDRQTLPLNSRAVWHQLHRRFLGSEVTELVQRAGDPATGYDNRRKALILLTYSLCSPNGRVHTAAAFPTLVRLMASPGDMTAAWVEIERAVDAVPLNSANKALELLEALPQADDTGRGKIVVRLREFAGPGDAPKIGQAIWDFWTTDSRSQNPYSADFRGALWHLNYTNCLPGILAALPTAPFTRALDYAGLAADWQATNAVPAVRQALENHRYGRDGSIATLAAYLRQLAGSEADAYLGEVLLTADPVVQRTMMFTGQLQTAGPPFAAAVRRLATETTDNDVRKAVQIWLAEAEKTK